MTTAETKWWATLKAHLRKMPTNVELHARSGEIGIAEAGALRAYSDAHGHADCVPEWDNIRISRLDGRDNHT